jgi:hypothetical protein
MPADALAVAESALAAVFAAPLDGGAERGFAGKDAALRAVIDGLTPEVCRALAVRLRTAKAGDELAAAFLRFNGDRREGLLAYLDDARRREVLRVEHAAR